MSALGGYRPHHCCYLELCTNTSRGLPLPFSPELPFCSLPGFVVPIELPSPSACSSGGHLTPLCFHTQPSRPSCGRVCRLDHRLDRGALLSPPALLLLVLRLRSTAAPYRTQRRQNKGRDRAPKLVCKFASLRCRPRERRLSTLGCTAYFYDHPSATTSYSLSRRRQSSPSQGDRHTQYPQGPVHLALPDLISNFLWRHWGLAESARASRPPDAPQPSAARLTPQRDVDVAAPPVPEGTCPQRDPSPGTLSCRVLRPTLSPATVHRPHPSSALPAPPSVPSTPDDWQAEPAATPEVYRLRCYSFLGRHRASPCAHDNPNPLGSTSSATGASSWVVFWPPLCVYITHEAPLEPVHQIWHVPASCQGPRLIT